MRKRIHPGEKLPLKLTATERQLILDECIVAGMEYEELLGNTPAAKPVLLTLDELDNFGGYIAAEANHCDDRKKQKRLDSIFQRIQDLLDRYMNEGDSEIPSSRTIKKVK